MPRLLLIMLLALSGCFLRFVAGNTDDATTQTLIGVRASTPGVVITIDTSSGSLCSPDDPDPQHTCPAQSGPDQR